jgi:hypothetical protein
MPLWEWNNAVVKLLDPPHGEPFLRLPDARDERAGPQTAADNQPADPVGDVEHTVPVFDLWNLLKKNRRVEFTHSRPPQLAIFRANSVCGTNPFLSMNSLTYFSVGAA